MVRRSAVLVLAAAALVATSTPSQAEPFVGRAGSTDTTVRLRGTDGRTYAVRFTLNALMPQSGSPSYTFDIGIARCVDGACGTAKRYTARPTPAQVKANEDLSSVTVRLTVLGTPLVVEWSALGATVTEPPAARVQSSVIDLTLQGAKEADVRVTAWGASCRTAGTYMSAYTVAPEGWSYDNGPTPPKAKPVQFAKRGRRLPTCAD